MDYLTDFSSIKLSPTPYPSCVLFINNCDNGRITKIIRLCSLQTPFFFVGIVERSLCESDCDIKHCTTHNTEK